MCKSLLHTLANCHMNTSISQDQHQLPLKLLKKLHKVRSKQNLCHHCSLPIPGIDILEFQKLVDLGDILSLQLFLAMDKSHNRFLGRTDFVNGVLRLGIGSEEEKFRTVFEVMDFGGKGYVDCQDVQTTVQELPTICVKCNEPVTYTWCVTDILKDMFRDTEKYSYKALWEVRQHYQDFFSDVLGVLTMGLPTVIFDILGICDPLNSCSSQTLSVNCEDFCPLNYQGRCYYFLFREECMYGYLTPFPDTPKILIFTKGLSIYPSEDTQFELKNCATTYTFHANTQKIRDKWVEDIQTAQRYRSFYDFYDVGECIGKGAQAIVYQATSKGSGLSAAIKIVSKDQLCRKNEMRIRREIRILKQVCHPNVLRLYDSFETSERFYLITEALTEGTLLTYLKQEDFQPSESFAKSIIRDLATGLLYLHSHHILHRDIKPDNVMLRKNNAGVLEAVLIDFGLSCFLGPNQTSTEPVGTLKYAAPEILARQPYGDKVDCWSLGVLLYILLVGKMPFGGKNDQEIAKKIVRRQMNVLATRWQDVSVEGKETVEGLLARKATDRWDMEELLNCKWLKVSALEETISTGTEEVPQLPMGEELVAVGVTC